MQVARADEQGLRGWRWSVSAGGPGPLGGARKSGSYRADRSDHVAESNINRLIHALEATRRAKVDAMAQRDPGYQPAVEVEAVDDFVTAENAESLLRV